MFKPVADGEDMPAYWPDGNIANQLLVIIYKLKIMNKDEAQWLMLEQLAYWSIQA